MRPREKAALYQELAKLTAADFHLDRSIALLLGQNPPPGRRSYLEGIQRGLAAGKSVATSVSVENAGMVTGLETSLIEAGERSGTMAAAFKHLARYFGAMDSAARQARAAMIYPLVLAHLAIALPELPAFFSQGGGNPLRNIGLSLATLWGIVLVGYVLWRILSRIAESSALMDGLLRLIPLIGSVRRHWALARFAQVFHSGLLAALRMSEILLLAGNASQSGTMARACKTAAKSVKETGQSMGGALADTRAFPEQFVLSVATAEAAGSLDSEMGSWAALETERASDAITRASLWLPKIGYCIVVAFVIYRIFAMVGGYYGVMQRQLEMLR